jgi:hypothetical protein
MMPGPDTGGQDLGTAVHGGCSSPLTCVGTACCQRVDLAVCSAAHMMARAVHAQLSCTHAGCTLPLHIHAAGLGKQAVLIGGPTLCPILPWSPGDLPNKNMPDAQHWLSASIAVLVALLAHNKLAGICRVASVVR